MNEVLEFLRSVLPWIGIGLFVAFSCVEIKAKKGGETLGKAWGAARCFPTLCFLLLGIADMLDGNKSSGTTWLVLSIFQAVTNFANRAEDMSESGSKKH